jgi:ABC-type enterochelin transport system ATPase subunit
VPSIALEINEGQNNFRRCASPLNGAEADLILVLDNGELVESSRHVELFSGRRAVSELYDAQIFTAESEIKRISTL